MQQTTTITFTSNQKNNNNHHQEHQILELHLSSGKFASNHLSIFIQNTNENFSFNAALFYTLSITLSLHTLSLSLALFCSVTSLCFDILLFLLL